MAKKKSCLLILVKMVLLMSLLVAFLIAGFFYAKDRLNEFFNRGETVEVPDFRGKHLLVGSIELERAIGASWGVAAFYDAGNAFDDLDTLEFAQGVGLGIRYYTPVGPIRLDIARQVGVSDPEYRFHFTVGMQF